jgi:uncharacterized membrane protein YcaP (DUF421 family)
MDYAALFFNSWPALRRTFIVTILAYMTMVFLLRVSRKRTLSKMTPFDMIIPLVLGPILASTILLPEVSLLQGLFAFVLLVWLHSMMAWLSARSQRVRTLIKREPVLLLHRGQFLWGTMQREEVSEEEICAAIRARGLPSLEDVEAVVLESDGSYNVVQRSSSQSSSSLSNVSGYPPRSSL